MRIRTLFLMTSLTATFACGGDDDDTGTATVAETSMSTTEPTSTTEGMTAATMTTDATESSGGSETLTTTENPETTVAESESSAGPADSSSSDSGSESGGAGSCQDYCDLFLEECADGVGGSATYDDEADCLATCDTWEEGSPGEAGGNTVQCRISHLTGLGDPTAVDDAYLEMHCPHADETGSGVCA